MARCAGIQNLVFVGHRGRYERKRMGSHLHIGDGRLDFRHMTSDATASCGPFFVMRMLFDGSGARTIQ